MVSGKAITSWILTCRIVRCFLANHDRLRKIIGSSLAMLFRVARAEDLLRIHLKHRYIFRSRRNGKRFLALFKWLQMEPLEGMRSQ